VNRKYILPLFLLIQIIGLKILTFFPEFIEKNYSNGLYVFLSKFSRILLGWFPFSIGDIIYGLLIIWVIRWIYKNRKENWKSKILSILSFASVLYFLLLLNFYPGEKISDIFFGKEVGRALPLVILLLGLGRGILHPV